MASPTFTQMSLFPTVEEQIEQIAQSQAEASAPAFSVGMVPEQAVERILSAGTNEPAGALRIYAQYQAGAPAGEMAVSLRKEFGTGGRGFTIDGTPYAVWFDENGFSINSGKSARYDKESLAPVLDGGRKPYPQASGNRQISFCGTGGPGQRE